MSTEEMHATPATMSRRGFLKLAAGSALGAAMLSMPSFALARELEVKSRQLKPVMYDAIPQNAIACGQQAPLIEGCYRSILGYAEKIRDAGLRREVTDLIRNPSLRFLQEYSSPAARHRIYTQLANQGLVDTAKTDEAHFFPVSDGKIQEFRTAPGSGYGSHHPYPGGLATHVNANMHITEAVCNTYRDVFMYNVNRDIAFGAELLHDIAKPFVFAWQKNGRSLQEYTIAGTGAHHIFSIAEIIYRGFPADFVVAQACAHEAPNSAKGNESVAGWLKAAAMIAGKDPFAYGLLNKTGDGIRDPHRQEGYIVHLGDHDWVLSSPAAQKSVAILKEIAKRDYGMSAADLEGARFNHFRNYIGSQLSYMFLNMLAAEPNGEKLIAAQVHKVILK